MPKTLEQLLADTATGDDVKITFADTEMTVGELRAFKRVRDAAAAAEADFKTKSAATLEAQKKAEKLAADSLALYEEAEKMRREPARTAPANGDIDWENDPVYKPIHQRLSKLETEQLKRIDDSLKEVQKTVGTGLQFVVDQYYRSRWNSIPEKDRPKDKSYRDFVKMAQDLNIQDEYHLPDPVMAWERSTAEQRRATEIEDARKKGIEEGKKAAAAASMPRPGGAPAPRVPATKQFKDLNEAISAAKQDPDILRMLEGDQAPA